MRKNDREVYGELLNDDCYQKEADGFYSMLQSFLLLHKNGLYNYSEVERRLASEQAYSARRNQLFLQIYRKIQRGYEQFLFRYRQYDFADMINHAKECVDENPDCACGYKYILLDEVQDLSRNRLLLIRSIINKNPGCKLFAVGDDWQSIYRFTGSDLTLIRNFEQVFGQKTRRSYIESTHRFGQPTIKISCDFIRQNPAQTPKTVHNIQNVATPIHIILNKDQKQKRGQDAESLQTILLTLIAEQGYEKLSRKTLQVISRYNHDIARLESESFTISPRDNDAQNYGIVWQNPRDQTQRLALDFCSIHKSKGITRDIVIVLNMNSNLMGMPARRESDPILDAMLAQDDSFPFAEERRLFYVAITRAREATFLIANRKNPSPFILEISDEIRESYGKLCPKCQTGELIRKCGKRGDIVYCSNHIYGCNYLKSV